MKFKKKLFTLLLGGGILAAGAVAAPLIITSCSSGEDSGSQKSVSITASAQSVAPNGEIVLTATGTNLSSSATYEWFFNGSTTALTNGQNVTDLGTVAIKNNTLTITKINSNANGKKIKVTVDGVSNEIPLNVTSGNNGDSGSQTNQGKQVAILNSDAVGTTVESGKGFEVNLDPSDDSSKLSEPTGWEYSVGEERNWQAFDNNNYVVEKPNANKVISKGSDANNTPSTNNDAIIKISEGQITGGTAFTATVTIPNGVPSNDAKYTWKYTKNGSQPVDFDTNTAVQQTQKNEFQLTLPSDATGEYTISVSVLDKDVTYTGTQTISNVTAAAPAPDITKLTYLIKITNGTDKELTTYIRAKFNDNFSNEIKIVVSPSTSAPK